jgi:hypothetical protein
MKYSRARAWPQSRASGWAVCQARGSLSKGHLCHRHGAAGAEVEVSLDNAETAGASGLLRKIGEEMRSGARLINIKDL